MSKPKKYESYKECIIRTPTYECWEMFTPDWTFSDIRSYMIEKYSIDESSIVEIQCSSVTVYKNAK